MSEKIVQFKPKKMNSSVAEIQERGNESDFKIGNLEFTTKIDIPDDQLNKFGIHQQYARGRLVSLTKLEKLTDGVKHIYDNDKELIFTVLIENDKNLLTMQEVKKQVIDVIASGVKSNYAKIQDTER